MTNGSRIDPVFIFSLPRAGSTLVQRVLASHSRISTKSEPWLLLPFLYSMKKEGIYAEYGHHGAFDAIEDFCRELPGGQQAYTDEIATMALRLYEKASKPGSRYFLDKTPRYHVLSEQIMKMFPRGKFIFLWRNPLAVAASIMETWKGGKWNLYAWKFDLFDGFEKIIEAFEKNRGNVLSVRYEDLVSEPESHWRRIFEYLELPFDPEILKKFTNVQLKGRMGDPVGVRNFSSLSQEPLEKWKKTLRNPIRKAWARRYIRWIGKERLEVMGYEMDAIMNDLAGPGSLEYAASDIIRIVYGGLYCAFDPRPLKYKLKLLPKWHRVHANL